MYTSSKKIHKDKDAEPTEFEQSVAQALFDIENTHQELKSDLKDLYINSANQIAGQTYYQHHAQPQEQSQLEESEPILPNPSSTHHTQPLTANIFQAFSPLSQPQPPLVDTTFPNKASPSFPLSPLLDQLSQPYIPAQPYQPQSSHVSEGPSRVPLENLPQDPLRATITRLVRQNQNLTQQIEWQKEVLKQIANHMQIPIPPSPPYDIDDDFDD